MPLDREEICAKHTTTADNCDEGACCQLLHFYVLIDPTQLPRSYFVKVIVLDMNDRHPHFDEIRKPYREIREDSPISTRIDLPIAKDEDSALNGVKDYQITQWLIGNRSHFTLDMENTLLVEENPNFVERNTTLEGNKKTVLFKIATELEVLNVRVDDYRLRNR
ncbi:hypothetical protein Ciccas_012160 [Cichlidogyrus casuarinus]|uniref:Cadherin domain-containing protein n=1 Tax=Cichlidogyrus casuarinus TaxID=1844966 RepID=A0ABD2PQ42_9PLAT